jgi:hypothetical protein
MHVRWVLSGKYGRPGSVLGVIRVPRQYCQYESVLRLKTKKETLHAAVRTSLQQGTTPRPRPHHCKVQGLCPLGWLLKVPANAALGPCRTPLRGVAGRLAAPERALQPPSAAPPASHGAATLRERRGELRSVDSAAVARLCACTIAAASACTPPAKYADGCGATRGSTNRRYVCGRTPPTLVKGA